jgi:hypothetical protein
VRAGCGQGGKVQVQHNPELDTLSAKMQGEGIIVEQRGPALTEDARYIADTLKNKVHKSKLPRSLSLSYTKPHHNKLHPTVTHHTRPHHTFSLFILPQPPTCLFALLKHAHLDKWHSVTFV